MKLFIVSSLYKLQKLSHLPKKKHLTQGGMDSPIGLGNDFQDNLYQHNIKLDCPSVASDESDACSSPEEAAMKHKFKFKLL